jgi:plastocyanin
VPRRPTLRPPLPGRIHGRLLFTGSDPTSINSDPIVVYLEPLESGEGTWNTTESVAVRQRDQRFSPSFTTAVVGQSVRFRNEDKIYHRIFSHSESNGFDLGTLRPGSSKTIALQYAGPLRYYCSLHPWERGTIFVAPSPYFDAITPPENYEILGVPPGRYRLRTWSETSPSVDRVITVHGGGFTPIELSIDGRSKAR